MKNPPSASEKNEITKKMKNKKYTLKDLEYKREN